MLLIINISLLYCQDKPQIFVQTGHLRLVSAVDFSGSGRYIVSGSHDQTVKLWDVETGEQIRTFICNAYNAGKNHRLNFAEYTVLKQTSKWRYVTIDLKNAPELEKDIISSLKDTVVRIPVTQAVIYGWYDNEMASYVNLLGDRIVSIAENM